MNQLPLIITAASSSTIVSSYFDEAPKRKWLAFIKQNLIKLTQADKDTLMYSDDTKTEALIINKQGERFPYFLQRTSNTKEAEKLESIGLIRIVSYEGGFIIATTGKRINPKAVTFAFTYQGVRYAQDEQGLTIKNDFRPDIEAILHDSQRLEQGEAWQKMNKYMSQAYQQIK